MKGKIGDVRASFSFPPFSPLFFLIQWRLPFLLSLYSLREVMADSWGPCNLVFSFFFFFFPLFSFSLLQNFSILFFSFSWRRWENKEAKSRVSSFFSSPLLFCHRLGTAALADSSSCILSLNQGQRLNQTGPPLPSLFPPFLFPFHHPITPLFFCSAPFSARENFSLDPPFPLPPSPSFLKVPLSFCTVQKGRTNARRFGILFFIFFSFEEMVMRVFFPAMD